MQLELVKEKGGGEGTETPIVEAVQAALIEPGK